MANTIKKGESLFIPFKNGESIYDSQLKPRMYKTKEQYDKFSYHFKDAEMVEYTEVVRCKDCVYWWDRGFGKGTCDRETEEMGLSRLYLERDFCSYGERREGE